MSKWAYRGLTRQKEEVLGVVDASDEIEARVRLRAMQIRPTELYESDSEGGFRISLKNLSFGSPVKLKHMIIFTRQFSSLIDSGVPVVQCLDILHDQEKRGVFKRVLHKVKEDIEGGSGLAEALGRHPRIFSDFFVRIVEAGEMSGTLDRALRRVGLQLEKLGRLKAKVVKAMTYPGITLVVAVVVLVFMLVKVIPSVAQLYSDNQATLPPITVFVLGLSDWFQQNFIFVFVGLFGGFFGFAVLLRLRAFREVWDPFILRVPLIGSLLKKSTVAKFARTMSTLIASGVPLLTAFEICEKIVGNLAVRALLHKTSLAVQEGKSIAQGLSSSALFPPMVIHMVNIGEMTGKLDELLNKVAEIYDDEVDDAVDQITGLLQPLLIVFVGVIVAFLLISMYLPIFQLAEKVGG